VLTLRLSVFYQLSNSGLFSGEISVWTIRLSVFDQLRYHEENRGIYIHTYIHTIGNYLYLFCVLNGAIKLSVFVCPTFAISGVANC